MIVFLARERKRELFHLINFFSSWARVPAFSPYACWVGSLLLVVISDLLKPHAVVEIYETNTLVTESLCVLCPFGVNGIAIRKEL